MERNRKERIREDRKIMQGHGKKKEGGEGERKGRRKQRQR